MTTYDVCRFAQHLVQDEYLRLGKWCATAKYFGIACSTLKSIALIQHEPQLSAIETILRKKGFALQIIEEEETK